LAEHTLILGIKTPYNKDMKYICMAFPSGYGKTNLSLIDFQQKYKDKGYEVFYYR
jgi:GTP-dependent phosphoenolpyruvate carboxykinase